MNEDAIGDYNLSLNSEDQLHSQKLLINQKYVELPMEIWRTGDEGQLYTLQQ